MWALTTYRKSGGYKKDKAGLQVKQGTARSVNAPRNADSPSADLVKLITSKRSKGKKKIFKGHPTDEVRQNGRKQKIDQQFLVGRVTGVLGRSAESTSLIR